MEDGSNCKTGACPIYNECLHLNYNHKGDTKAYMLTVISKKLQGVQLNLFEEKKPEVEDNFIPVVEKHKFEEKFFGRSYSRGWFAELFPFLHPEPMMLVIGVRQNSGEATYSAFREMDDPEAWLSLLHQYCANP